MCLCLNADVIIVRLLERLGSMFTRRLFIKTIDVYNEVVRVSCLVLKHKLLSILISLSSINNLMKIPTEV